MELPLIAGRGIVQAHVNRNHARFGAEYAADGMHAIAREGADALIGEHISKELIWLPKTSYT